MTPPHLSARQGMGLASQLVPILCLIGVVVLLSSITPAIKYVQAMYDFNMMAVACQFIGKLVDENTIPPKVERRIERGHHGKAHRPSFPNPTLPLSFPVCLQPSTDSINWRRECSHA